MKRREFLSVMGGASAAFSCAQVQTRQTDEPGKQPNILFLFTDDQTFRSIGSLNNPAVHTPNLDKLVRRGITFTHCFNQGSWTGAVCVASRAMLNTGQFIYHAQKSIGGSDGPSVPLWGETFGKAGYDTFFTGKWHNGNPAMKKSFNHIGPHGGGMLHSTPYDGEGYNRPAEGNTWTPHDPKWEGHWQTKEDGSIIHSSKWWADSAIEYIGNRKGMEQNPFFMYVAFHAPHDPRQAPKEYVDMYPLDEIEIPPNYLPEHPFDNGDLKLRDEILAPFPRTEHDIKVHLQEYYAIISHADAQIGRILKALDESGEADNTYIVFSADHGLAVGQHGLLGKQNQYEHSIRMPLIISGPGIMPGGTNDAMVYLQSMYATTCELAGVQTPDTVEFPSIVPLINGTKHQLHDAIYGSYRHVQRMVRTEDYKLIYYPEINKIQLFDMKRDPWELNDLADIPNYGSIKTILIKRLYELQQDVGDELQLQI